ncbi:MAG: P-II family nitrogen regulator [Pseudomonadota bacterium]
MEIKAVIAMVRRDALEAVETKLQQAGVQGITVTKSKGYGDHRNFFTRDWMSDGVRVEIYTAADRVGAIVRAITDAAHTGEPGDGLVVVLPVDQAFSVRTRAETVPNRPRG